MKGTVNLTQIYATVLVWPGARNAWALTTLYNYIDYGADDTNAFIEAPPHTTSLYFTINNVYRGRGKWLKLTLTFLNTMCFHYSILCKGIQRAITSELKRLTR